MHIQDNEVLQGLINVRLALETQVNDFLDNMTNDEVDTDKLEYFTVVVPTINGEEEVHKISWNAAIFNELNNALKECIITEAEDDLIPLAHIKLNNGPAQLANAFVYDPIKDRVIETIDVSQLHCDQVPIEIASDNAKSLYRMQEAVVCEYCEDEHDVKRWYVHSAVGIGKMAERMIQEQIKKHITYIWE